MKKSSKTPEISVIMAVYNGMPYLKEAVKSILCQTFKNFEFIIVDDGSNDKTSAFLKSLKDKRVKIITNNKNIGLALSLNKAIHDSKGEYVARMDADDISYPTRFLTQLSFMKSHNDIDLCGSWATLLNSEGKIVGIKKNPFNDEGIKKKLGIYPTIIHPTFFGKRKFFKNNGYVNEFDGAEDYELLCRAKNKYKYANIPETLLYWRLRNDRRSIKMMDKMHNLDMKIKKNYLKSEGYSIYNVYGYLKMLLLHFLIPLPVKRKISRLLKIA